MEDKPPLPINPNGLIRSYLAQQHTAQQPVVTPLPAVVQPITPLPGTLQPKTMLLPVVAPPSTQAYSRRAPILIKPSGVSEPFFSLAQLPIRPAATPDVARFAAQTGSGSGMQPRWTWPPSGNIQLPGAGSLPASTQATAQPTTVLPAIAPLAPDLPIDEPVEVPEQAEERVAKARRKRTITRVILVLVALGLVATLYIIWHGSATSVTSPTVTQQQLTTPTSATNTPGTAGSGGTGGIIQAYITGAVQHPGVYKLASGARVYELLRMAGGPLPSANLVALNLAAKLTDGEEVYVLSIGETPPVSVMSPPVTGTGGTTSGSLVNINTASATDMRQLLHVSSTTAQKIIDYRQQHGSYTSVDQLLQVVSKSIYDKIKALVTV